MTRFTNLAKQFSKYNDNLQMKKMLQLIEKVDNKQAVIGFCGHFSAGKSTMLNNLLEKDVLPSSPIPTSANLVRVKKGDTYARIYYTDDKAVQFSPPIDMEAVRELCKDGTNVFSLEISDEDVSIPNNIVLMDTPGIDSTDEAHRLATESSLHLADVIFYVMDYNHVQSEVNFTFSKTLQEMGKDVYLIVNQIDKHDERELSFTSFQQSTMDSFANWGVYPKGIFYTTLYEPSHSANQFYHVQQLLHEQSMISEEDIIERAFVSAKQIINDHLNVLEEDQDERRAQLEQIIGDADLAVLSDKMNLLEQLKQQHEKEPDMFEKAFRDDLDELLNNAYIMPATTRELAHHYLESRQPDFKVGILFAKKKTDEERQVRLKSFYEDFRDKVDKELSFHIKGFLEKMFKSYDLDDVSLLSQIHNVQIEFNENVLKDTVKTGAGVTGDYVLNYTNDVSTEIKRLYRYELIPLMHEAKNLLQNNNKEVLSDLSKQLTEISATLAASNELGLLNKTLFNRKEEMELLLISGLNEDWGDLLEWLQSSREVINEAEAPLQLKEQQVKQVNPIHNDKQGAEHNVIESEVDETIALLQKGAQAVEPIKGMTSYVKSLRSKAEKLSERNFTFALFGAFSAGKSSFANALIGEAVLPVSPNPTTAAINKIAPPDDIHPDGTVVIKFKDEEQLLTDLNAALTPFNRSSTTVQEGLEAVGSLQKSAAEDNVQLAFLQAAKKGYNDVKSKLGKVISVPQDEFAAYAATEEKSCFVEWMTLYKDCPLTENGITLVDTPGADSINARHTNTAFHYIRNADAVLFVTYYNHAFSKADREFLIQLGRVKETFELDKMFFIVNASDLAKTNEELNDVVEYVSDELTTYGIRKPRIYPISSKRALEAKNGKPNSYGDNFLVFEDALQRFIQNELTNVAVQAAKTDLQHTKERVQSLLTVANEGAEQKAVRKEAALMRLNKSLEMMRDLSSEPYKQSVLQEVEELIHYVEQRIFLRFTDFYNESFHPGAFRNADAKTVMQSCMQELINSIGFDLSQEMRATTLRVEKFINEKLYAYDEKLQKIGIESDEGLSFLEFERLEFDEQVLENGLQRETVAQYRSVLNQFKSTKHFFEQGGKLAIREVLKEQIRVPVRKELKEYVERFKNHYKGLYAELSNEQLNSREKDLKEYYEAVLEALSETVDTTALEHAYQQLKQHH
ncbi:hypothetical protein BFG57_14015 [Bacillus solimangrovi]|uniref:Dynamin N-terminal domain-containing protein n=1 Tax=Bacillus solimangrovi TaxID=1305675 RepID=A0A1E5LG09_9BACI|nr:hypothetical protein BFG57_14015 [Bacillus solimangrovi]